jgi:hypothetical protein
LPQPNVRFRIGLPPGIVRITQGDAGITMLDFTKARAVDAPSRFVETNGGTLAYQLPQLSADAIASFVRNT